MNIDMNKIAGKKKIERRVEPPDTFLEENHPMTISSKFCSYCFVVYKCCPKMPFPFNFQIKILILEGHITRKFTLTNKKKSMAFSNFLLTNLFSIKFLHFFIISSLFPYFNLFVSIFIQSHATSSQRTLYFYLFQT
jgi:hypothetical protein